MTDSQNKSISVVEKNGRVFVGLLNVANEIGVDLIKAREIKNRDAVFVATFGLDESDMKNNVSPQMDDLVIHRIDLLIRPNPLICEDIKRLFGIF
jgi:hypothetical protein